ncbi:hypothetical protein B9Q09_00345 [Candidatus Marsarchaeota G2 archaeon ECH_B_SAG-C16]|jgi:hypothetical protein|uniref:Uncharacterized protein n=1 Tax=Candidatus Marsarchaeota G2 archaeon ECH_B_SAG-C16 TaxID=1978163 RepID=A0A2R6BGJ0_9ARCH|nr:MAG: hypothetical protein B9Q09_00345 [Candidatus Marsarchaeota G2 archaeon ECH_B_SAG-C16]
MLVNDHRGVNAPIIALVAVVIVVAFGVVYSAAFQRGYSYGFHSGFNSGFSGELFHFGTSIPLTPGSELSVDLDYLKLAFGATNVTVNLYGEFSVLGAGGAPTNNSVTLYVTSGGRTLYSTGYVSDATVNASIVLNLGDGSSVYLIVKANPFNNQVVNVFWNSDLRMNLKPQE